MYRIFSMSGNPVYAAPASSRRVRLGGIGRYQPFSLKRRAYREGVRSLIWLGADRWFSRVSADPIREASGIDFATWMESASKVLGAEQLDAVLFWPPQPDRGRVYVHMLGENQRPVGFAKISFDGHNDMCFENEARTLEQMGRQEHSHFRVPRILKHVRPGPGSHASLIFEPIPADARPLENEPGAFPANCQREIAGKARPMGGNGCYSLSWWPEFERRIQLIDPGFMDRLLDAETDASLLCRTHGNFTLGNMVRDSRENLWVFDWEESCDDGPLLSDEIGFFLKTRPVKQKLDLGELLSRFRDRFLSENAPQQRLDVMLALAFCATVYAEDAGAVIRNWNDL